MFEFNIEIILRIIKSVAKGGGIRDTPNNFAIEHHHHLNYSFIATTNGQLFTFNHNDETIYYVSPEELRGRDRIVENIFARREGQPYIDNLGGITYEDLVHADHLVVRRMLSEGYNASLYNNLFTVMRIDDGHITLSIATLEEYINV